MSKEDGHETCDKCGAKLNKYPSIVNHKLAGTLIKLRRLEVTLGKREIRIGHDDLGVIDQYGNHLELTLNEHRNMTRLRFLSLARPKDTKKTATWIITRNGYKFLRGEPVIKKVWTFRNRIIDEMRTDETTTLAEVFRRKKEDIPYFNPVTDAEIATEAEMAKAVQQSLL